MASGSESTPEHPFYVEGKGWVNSEDLQMGDQVRWADGTRMYRKVSYDFYINNYAPTKMGA